MIVESVCCVVSPQQYSRFENKFMFVNALRKSIECVRVSSSGRGGGGGRGRSCRIRPCLRTLDNSTDGFTCSGRTCSTPFPHATVIILQEILMSTTTTPFNPSPSLILHAFVFKSSSKMHLERE